MKDLTVYGTPTRKWYHFKKWLKLDNKKGTLVGDFSFSPLNPPKIKPPFDLLNEEKGGLTWYPFRIGQNFRQQKWYDF